MSTQRDTPEHSFVNDAGLLTDTEQALVTAARIVDAYRGKPVPWVHRATLRFAAHMMWRTAVSDLYTLGNENDEGARQGIDLRDSNGDTTGEVFVPVEPTDLIDFDAAWIYHTEMWGSLTDTEDWHNHVSNIVRHALGLPLGDFTGQIEPEHYEFMAEQKNQHE